MFRVALIMTVLTAIPALAQEASKCVKRSDLLDQLATNFNEAPVAMGLTTGGKVLEVVVSADGSWTIIVTTTSGISCGVASGKSWEKVSSSGAQEPNA